MVEKFMKKAGLLLLVVLTLVACGKKEDSKIFRKEFFTWSDDFFWIFVLNSVISIICNNVYFFDEYDSKLKKDIKNSLGEISRGKFIEFGSVRARHG